MTYDDLASLCCERGRSLLPQADIHCAICNASRTLEYGCSLDAPADNFILWGVCLECSLLPDFVQRADASTRAQRSTPTALGPVARIAAGSPEGEQR